MSAARATRKASRMSDRMPRVSRLKVGKLGADMLPMDFENRDTGLAMSPDGPSPPDEFKGAVSYGPWDSDHPVRPRRSRDPSRSHAGWYDFRVIGSGRCGWATDLPPS